jgi:PKD repeat protein
MKTTLAFGGLCLLFTAGCPLSQTGTPSAISIEIATSSTSGPAPLVVSFSAAGSTSTNGGTLTYAWDFGDGTSSDLAVVTHTFQNPGRYIVRLQITDEAGEQGLASVDIRAAGTGAVAVIGAEPTSGPAALVVQFDGTASQVPDDTVLDYYWDFGDGTQSREARPMHIFGSDGTYTVVLRIVTAGGLEATTSTTITVGQANASLQFAGTNFATLPLGSAQDLAAFTLEAWVKAENDGGTIASLGNGVLTLNVQPLTNAIGVQISGTPLQAPATNLAGIWRHVAVVYDTGTAGVCVLYLDGVALANVPVTDPLSADHLTLGIGLRGKIGEVRLWVEARTGSAILSAKDHRLSGHESNLLGYWPLSEGSGQILNNQANPAVDGMLGSTTAVETADPAWSTDGPPL